MREMFYNIVEMITEWITGSVNGEIKLWELYRYLEVSSWVTAVLNGVIIVAISVIAFSIIYPIVRRIFKVDEFEAFVANMERSQQ